MQTFDFKTARTRVTALERKFKAIHDKLKEIALPVETASTITTMLNDAQTEMTQDILTGKLRQGEVINNGIATTVTPIATTGTEAVNDTI